MNECREFSREWRYDDEEEEEDEEAEVEVRVWISWQKSIFC